MSISNALHFSPAGTTPHGLQHITLPSLTARQEYALIVSALAGFLAGGSAVALYALSAIGQ
jgi:hypothetical protein